MDEIEAIRQIRQILLSRPDAPAPRKGDIGEGTDWLPMAELQTEGQFWIGEAEFLGMPEKGGYICVEPGTYEASVKVMYYGSVPKISRMRACRTPNLISRWFRGGGAEATLVLSDEECWADSGTAGIADSSAWSRIMERDDEDAVAAQVVEALKGGEGRLGVITYQPDGVRAVWAMSGFGDGTYPIFELRQGDRCVGAEIEFIAPNAPYPF